MRKFVLPSCSFWFGASRTKTGAEATMAMEQVVNHLESALCEAIRQGFDSEHFDKEVVELIRRSK